jgi:hypothetical protein
MPPEVIKLLKIVTERSEAGELQWQAAGDSATSFVHTGRAGSVSIVSDDGDGEHPYTFSLLTPEGVTGDSWKSVDNSGQEPEVESYWRELQQLYHAARRSAAGSTTLVKDLLNEIAPDDIPF